MAKARSGQSAAEAASLSDKISSLARTQRGIEWPARVVDAMRALKDHADRLQALADTAAAGGSKIGDLAATMDADPDPVAAGEGW